MFEHVQFLNSFSNHLVFTTLLLSTLIASEIPQDTLFNACTCSPDALNRHQTSICNYPTSTESLSDVDLCRGIVDIGVCRHYLDPQLPGGRLNLREEDFSLNDSSLCFSPSLLEGENFSTLKGFAFDVNQWEQLPYIHYSRLACFYPNGVETREELEDTVCCTPLKTPVKEGTHITISGGSIPPTHGNRNDLLSIFRPIHLNKTNLGRKKAQNAVPVTKCPVVTYPTPGQIGPDTTTTEDPTSSFIAKLQEMKMAMIIVAVSAALLLCLLIIYLVYIRGWRTKGSDGLKDVELRTADSLSLHSAHEAMETSVV